MIYFFYDNKTGKAFPKARKLFNDLQKKKPDGTFLSFDENTVTPESLREASESQGLFESKVVGYLKNISENELVETEFKKLVKELASSSSIFVWVESSLKKPELEALEKAAEKSFLESEVPKKEKEDWNVFKIGEAFGGKDKKNLWRYILEAKRREIAAEEIHGILWWQLKSIILAESSKTASESGLKPFVYSKAKGFAKKFEGLELQNMADSFISMHHEAHRGNCDLYDELEKMALEFK